MDNREGIVFLLLGGIGSGKTTYLNRFSGYVEKEFLDKNALWFYIDFKFSPSEDQIEEHVKRNILEQLRKDHANLKLEERTISSIGIRRSN